MHLEEGHIYHIYNRGNNKTQVYFNRNNYLYFLGKLPKFILPYCSIMAWCLMPNHFHLMIYVHRLQVVGKNDNLNSSIGRLLSSYTRAINKQNGRTGSLFQKHTKAKCLTKLNSISENYWQSEFGTIINLDNGQFDYPQACLKYIHQNPVTNSLVNDPIEWEFSSYRDYYKNRNGKLIDYELSEKELGVVREVKTHW